MNCHYCGAPLQGNEIFCRHCGTRQQRAPQAEPEVPAVLQEAAPVPEAAQTPVKRSTTVYKEKHFDWQPYGAPVKEEPLVDFENTVPAGKTKLQLGTKRSLWKMIVFGILTLGIYPLVIWSRLTSEVNLVASRYDGERSMPFLGMLMLAPLTLGIHSLVWMHKLCRRIGAELQRRDIDYAFNASDFWIWAFLMGMLSGICFSICGVLASIGFDVLFVLWVLLAVALFTLTGPFVFTAKLMKATNHLNAHFNING